MIKAEIIADSINSKDCRLTTFILEYPRFVHAELLTHRVFSKNSASSRAIPSEKFIEEVMQRPAMPVWWGKNQSGMQANEELDDTTPYWDIADYEYKKGEHFEGVHRTNPRKVTRKGHAQYEWLRARNLAIQQANIFNKIGLHKQIANRVLEPWFNIRVILTGTEFDNFIALRAHKDAQPEIRDLAFLMLDALNRSEPVSLEDGEWHIPFGDKMDEDKLHLASSFRDRGGTNSKEEYSLFLNEITEIKKKIAVARCARVSYLNFEGKDDYEADIKLCDRLFGSVPRHLSPAEHVAQAMDNSDFIGNFRGFKQYRKFFAEDNLNDPRLIKKKYKSS